MNMKKGIIILNTTLALLFAFSAVTYSFEKELFPGETELYEKAKKEMIVVSYDTGPGWANWVGEFAAFEKRYTDLTIVYNDLGSGVTVARLDKEKVRPHADTAYYSIPYGPIAKTKGVTEGFKPPNFDKLPPQLKDSDGHWFAIHVGTVAICVNNKLVKKIPKGWNDLLKPEYKNHIVYLDPRTTGIGHAIVLATAYAMGGNESNVKPGVEYLAKLQKAGNIKRYEATVEYAKFLKGEIPIWITYDFNAYKAKYIGESDCTVIIPKEGTITAPYVKSLVKNAPHPNAGKLWLSFILSDEGQKIFAEGFVRPVVPGVKLPPDVAAKFLPSEDYKVAHNVDWVMAGKTLDEVKKLWTDLVLGGK